MNRCFQLALNGLGTTSPNPMVGCVIVANGNIIGEGWHRKAGEPHAEVLAIRQVINQELLKQATLYVSLEPCAHFGRTPPCANLIVEKQIPRVVIGCRDPFEAVAGKGIEILQSAGIEVIEGDWAAEAQRINRRFITFHQKRRPYIILKWAESLDGFVAPAIQKEGESVAISGKTAQLYNHKWRTEEAAILVGYQTALKDNPRLTARKHYGNQPMRIVIDPHGEIPLTHHLLSDGLSTLWVTRETQNLTNPQQVENLVIPKSENLVQSLVKVLYEKHIQSVIVEGGPATHAAFDAAGCVDEYRVFRSKHLVLGNGVPSFTFSNAANGTSSDIVEDVLVVSEV